MDLEPTYTEWHPDAAGDSAGKALVISPDGRNNSAAIRQDAEVYRVRLEPGARLEHELRDGRGLWLQVIQGSAAINGAELEAGDGASSEQAGRFEISAHGEAVEALLFDLA